MRIHLGYWVVLICAGCGGSGGTVMGNSVSGTVDGVTVSALGAIFLRDSNDEDGVHHELAHVAVGESADLCSIWRGSYIGKKNSNVLTLDFEGPDNSTVIVGPDKYPQWQGTSGPRSGANVVGGMFNVGPTCDFNDSMVGAIATGGSVKLVTSTDASMAGTFSFSFADPNDSSKSLGQASGSFDATPCAPSNTTPPCQ